MKFDFETRVDRRKCGNLKYMSFTPETIRKKGLVSYAGAEFEFKTAKPVTDAIRSVVDNGLFGFTVADDNYYSHVCWWMKEVRRVEVEPSWIVPAQGTIFSVATAIRMLTKEGEGVIIPTPGYNRYEQAAVRLGRHGVFCEMPEKNGVPTLDLGALEKAMAKPENHLLVLCNPNNPTGRILTEDVLRQILRLAKACEVAVICDEIFADIVYDGRTAPLMAALGSGTDSVISVTSLGKTFSLTGVNHANVIIKNKALRERYIRQRNADHFGSIDPMVYAALCGGYSPEGKEWLEELMQVLSENYRLLSAFFAEYLPAVKVVKPEGTYEVWADFSGLGLGEEELFRFLMEEAWFCCDRGEEYYGKACTVRICTAVPKKDLIASLELLRAAAARRGLSFNR